MRQLKEYKTLFATPLDEEIREGIEIAKRDNCIVRISFFVPYHGNNYLDIEPESTFEECYNRVHATYPV